MERESLKGGGGDCDGVKPDGLYTKIKKRITHRAPLNTFTLYGC